MKFPLSLNNQPGSGDDVSQVKNEHAPLHLQFLVLTRTTSGTV